VTSVDIRDLTSHEACRAVVDLQVAVWGRDAEIVPASVLLVSAKRGGILVGAYDESRLVGFVWSMPGWRNGQATHWSHMLAVHPDARRRGLGEALKLAQRDRALAQRVDLIEWTFDPLQAPNAHLNFSRLGATASTYLVNAYGEMQGPLHRGTATDRLIAEWSLRSAHVERRIASIGAGSASPARAVSVRSAELASAPVAIDTRDEDGWAVCGATKLALDARRIFIPVPPNFTEMLQEAPELARRWRETTRHAFTEYFARGYRAVDFFQGRYLLVATESDGAGVNLELRTSN